MTDLEQLTAWLEQPDYDAGVMLYQRLIGSGFKLILLKQGEDNYNRHLLEKALADKQEELLTAFTAKQAAMPPELKTNKLQGGRLMDERLLLKERMRQLVDQGITQSDELKQMAFRVLAINEELDEIFGQERFWEEHGYLPGDDVPAETSPAELLQRRNTLRTYVTRYSKKLADAVGDDQQRKLKQKLDSYQTELFQVQKQLDHATLSNQ